MPELENSNLLRITFIGFGEAGYAFATGFLSTSDNLLISAFDLKTTYENSGASKFAEYASAGVNGLNTAENQSDLIFSTVTAEDALVAATSVAASPLNNALYFDCNSCAPGTKVEAAAVIEAAGGRYVDTAVMAPVGPQLKNIPVLLSGPHAEVGLAALTNLGMTGNIAAGPVGTASTRKMVRSIMIKGLEALTLECFLAARKSGVESEVLASLEKSFEGFGWEKRGSYNMERVMTHGIRRAAEMREVAKTVAQLDLPNDMAEATAKWQQRVGDMGLLAGDDDLLARADMLLAALAGRRDI